MPVEAPFDAGTRPVPAGLPFTRKDVAVAAALFILGLILYLRTLAPDLLFGDSGEFQVLAITGGLAHAFGYPVYLVIAKLFTFLPFEPLPARVSMVSSVFAAESAAKVYLLGRALNVRRAYCVIGAIALMISPLFWWQAIIAEIYTISADFLIGFILCAVIWNRTRDGRWLAAGGLFGGLCLGLHHSVLLAAPFVLIYLAICRARKSDWAQAGAGALTGVALSLAAYMIMASIDSPPTSTNFLRPLAVQYGLKSPADFESPITRVKFVFLAEQFRGDFQTKHFAPNIPRIAGEVQDDFGWVIPVFALAGIITLLARSSLRRAAVLFIGSYVVLLVVPMFLDAFDLEVEFIQAHMIMCVLAVIGLQGLQDLIFRKRLLGRGLAFATGAAATAIFVGGTWSIFGGAGQALAAAKPTFLTGVRSKFPYPVDTPTAVHDLATNVISTVPDKAMLLTDWSYMDACYYVALFEQNKPEIEIVAPMPDGVLPPALSEQMTAFYLENAKAHPLFSDKAPIGMTADFTETAVLMGEDSGKVYLYSVVPKQPPK